MNRFLTWFRRYRWPITIGGGAVVAYTAYSNAQQRVAAAQAAAAASSVPAGAPLSPEQVSALVGQGAQLATAAQAPLVDLASGGLNIAGIAAQGAQGLAEVAVGNLGGAIGTLGDLAGQLGGLLPSFAPAGGIQPQPTSPIYTGGPSGIASQPIRPSPVYSGGPSGIASQPTAPTPTSGGTSSTTGGPGGKTLTGYKVHVTGSLNLYTFEGGQFVPHHGSFSRSSAPVTRAVWGGRVAWITAAGAYKGDAYVVGLTGGDWFITREYSDGTNQRIPSSGS